MLFKTSGIVLNTIKYSDTSIIAKIYTSSFGLQSYIVAGTRSKKSNTKASLFQPLAIVELQVTHSAKSKLQRIKEINILHHPISFQTNIYKNSMVLFLNEVLNKSLRETHSDESLFEFIKNFLLILDLKSENFLNFHIYFMLQLTKYLGFFPHGEFSATTNYFDIKEGRFTTQPPKHQHYIEGGHALLLNLFFSSNLNKTETILINNTQRRKVLSTLILFFQLHIENFGEIKSLKILEEIIS